MIKSVYTQKKNLYSEKSAVLEKKNITLYFPRIKHQNVISSITCTCTFKKSCGKK